MIAAVIGLGSMGKRRLRLIQKYNASIRIVGVDTSENRRTACVEEYGIQTYGRLEDLFHAHRVDCAFICTSPLSHHSIITPCLEQGVHVFSELNLVADGYEQNIALAKKNDQILFMSSTFLYRDEIREIKSQVRRVKSPLNYTYHVGQYLPDWHPWESYKDYFVGDKRSNGCRELFAIELPWLIDVFGEIVNVNVVKNKISTLNIDYNDNYLVVIEHSSGHKGTLALDVISRKAVRNLEVFGEELFLSWNGSPTGLKVYDFENKTDMEIDVYNEIDQLGNYAKFVVENAYLNEIVSFFESIHERKVPIYTFENDLEIIKLIDKIEG